MNRMPPAVEMDLVVGPKAEGARRATGAFGPTATSAATAPDPEVPAKAQRRRFTAEYRLGILKQADACKRPGELGALLRREGLYSSRTWRIGDGSVSRAPCGTCGDVGAARPHVRSTRV